MIYFQKQNKVLVSRIHYQEFQKIKNTNTINQKITGIDIIQKNCSINLAKLIIKKSYGCKHSIYFLVIVLINNKTLLDEL